MKTRQTKGESSSKGRESSGADTQIDFTIDLFKKSSKIPRVAPADEENKDALRTSRRLSAQSETPQDPKIATPELESTQAINTGLLLQNTNLNQRNEELKTQSDVRDEKKRDTDGRSPPGSGR